MPEKNKGDMEGKISIFLADDHDVVRQGLRALLQAEPGFVVVGEASEGISAVDRAVSARPEVLVVDLMMPGLGGFEVSRQVKKRSPKTAIVVLSMHATEPYVVEALRSGASAYVAKDADASELIAAIREAAAGRRYLGSPFSGQPIEEFLRKAESPAADSYDTLTRREREVLQLAAEGLTSNELANRLTISPRTAETHRAHIMKKLGLRGQTELVRYALRRGLLPLETNREPIE